MRKLIEMDLDYMNTIPAAPQSSNEMYQQACSNDKVTVDNWRDRWIANTKENHAKYGPFKDKSIGSLYGLFDKKPVIVAGSGPSLANSVEGLKNTHGIPIVSCLHNFHYMVDNGIPVDFFVTLDAGDITIPEISEGGSRTHEEYLELTRNKTLLAFIGSPTKLLDSWRGKILFFNCPIPDAGIGQAMAEIEPFHTYVSTGGNVLGACTYIAKAILGANPVVWVGADFCFSYTKAFHPWKSKYDGNVGQALRAIDVFGNSVLTWQSYHNFKVWFDWLASNVLGFWVNCSEGGTLGSYPEGNIAAVKQMRLTDLIRMYSMYEEMREQCVNPLTDERKIMF